MYNLDMLSFICILMVTHQLFADFPALLEAVLQLVFRIFILPAYSLPAAQRVCADAVRTRKLTKLAEFPNTI